MVSYKIFGSSNVSVKDSRHSRILKKNIHYLLHKQSNWEKWISLSGTGFQQIFHRGITHRLLRWRLFFASNHRTSPSPESGFSRRLSSLHHHHITPLKASRAVGRSRSLLRSIFARFFPCVAESTSRKTGFKLDF